jgi:hypothetical protein
LACIFSQVTRQVKWISLGEVASLFSTFVLSTFEQPLQVCFFWVSEFVTIGNLLRVSENTDFFLECSVNIRFIYMCVGIILPLLCKDLDSMRFISYQESHWIAKLRIEDILSHRTIWIITILSKRAKFCYLSPARVLRCCALCMYFWAHIYPHTAILVPIRPISSIFLSIIVRVECTISPSCLGNREARTSRIIVIFSAYWSPSITTTQKK